jgi:hypothetical protein
LRLAHSYAGRRGSGLGSQPALQIVKFNDTELERIYQLNFRAAQDSEDEDQRQICSLFAALDWFRRSEGEQSVRLREVGQILLSPEMRPALRRWYKRCGDGMNPVAMALREQLSALAGERFG